MNSRLRWGPLLLCSELFNKDHKTTKCHGTGFIGHSYF